ncbi:MerR family transcriptional regulator [candidate division KSB1 bacterium]|nr:MerR family transcriptional regulator [candidate division KSB1 bacterium]
MKNIQWLSSSEVREKLNISLRQLYYWELKGIVTPHAITMGSREFKRYSMSDFNRLQKVKDLLDQGFTLASAAQRAQTNFD